MSPAIFCEYSVFIFVKLQPVVCCSMGGSREDILGLCPKQFEAPSAQRQTRENRDAEGLKWGGDTSPAH